MIISKLKKLKQYEKAIELANKMLDVQGQSEDIDKDYVLGLYNGMESVMAIIENRGFRLKFPGERGFMDEKDNR